MLHFLFSLCIVLHGIAIAFYITFKSALGTLFMVVGIPLHVIGIVVAIFLWRAIFNDIKNSVFH